MSFTKNSINKISIVLGLVLLMVSGCSKVNENTENPDDPGEKKTISKGLAKDYLNVCRAFRLKRQYLISRGVGKTREYAIKYNTCADKSLRSEISRPIIGYSARSEILTLDNALDLCRDEIWTDLSEPFESYCEELDNNTRFDRITINSNIYVFAINRNANYANIEIRQFFKDRIDESTELDHIHSFRIDMDSSTNNFGFVLEYQLESRCEVNSYSSCLMSL